MELGYMTLAVKDLAASMEFYGGLLGFTPADAPAGAVSYGRDAWLTIVPGQYLHLAEHSDPSDSQLVRTGIGVYPTGFHHICLEVEPIDPYYRRIVDAGWPLERELLRGLDGNRQFWLRDPDGYPVEFMEMAPDSLQLKSREV